MGLGYNQGMMEIDKRRRRFMVQIKRQSKEEYFRSRREELLNLMPSSRLCQLLKMSLLQDGILDELRNGPLLQQLTEAAQSSRHVEYRYVMAICSNALLDHLSLQEKQAIAELLYRIYKKHGTSGGSDTQGVAASLYAFAKTLPFLGEEIAVDGENVVCELAIQIIGRAIGQQASKMQSEQVKETMHGVECLLEYQSEDLPQLEQHFSRNVLFYNGLLQLHPLLLKDPSPHNLVVRESMMRIFHKLSLNIQLSNFPLIFQGSAFSNFLLNELLSNLSIYYKQLSLDLFCNLLIDYSECDCSMLMDQLAKPANRVESVFRTLLNNDQLIFWRLKAIKLLLAGGKIEMDWLFDDYWKVIADLCMEVLKGMNLSAVLLALNILILLEQRMKGDQAYMGYLRGAGAEPIMECLLDQLDNARRTNEIEDEQMAMSIEDGLQYLINKLQQWD